MALAAISLVPTFPGAVNEVTTSPCRLSPTLPSPCWCLLYLRFPHIQHYPESAAAANASRGWPLWLCSWENLRGVNTLGWEKKNPAHCYMTKTHHQALINSMLQQHLNKVGKQFHAYKIQMYVLWVSDTDQRVFLKHHWIFPLLTATVKSVLKNLITQAWVILLQHLYHIAGHPNVFAAIPLN
jgi:hypothetical protein